jgi:hypothetical protein
MQSHMYSNAKIRVKSRRKITTTLKVKVKVTFYFSGVVGENKIILTALTAIDIIITLMNKEQ